MSKTEKTNNNDNKKMERNITKKQEDLQYGENHGPIKERCFKYH